MSKTPRRSLTEKTPETLRKILDASHRVFARDGLEAATMDGIAAEAGLSKQILYYYFDGKDDLNAKVMTEIAVQAHEPLFDFDYSSVTPLEGIRHLFKTSFDWNRFSPGILAADQMVRGGAFIREGDVVQQAGKRVTQLYGDLVARGQADGSIKQEIDPVFVHMLAWILNVGFISSRKLLGRYLAQDITGEDQEQAWKLYAADVIVDSLAARSERCRVPVSINGSH